jgi:hypothetical protein
MVTCKLRRFRIDSTPRSNPRQEAVDCLFRNGAVLMGELQWHKDCFVVSDRFTKAVEIEEGEGNGKEELDGARANARGCARAIGSACRGPRPGVPRPARSGQRRYHLSDRGRCCPHWDCRHQRSARRRSFVEGAGAFRTRIFPGSNAGAGGCRPVSANSSRPALGNFANRRR